MRSPSALRQFGQTQFPRGLRNLVLAVALAMAANDTGRGAESAVKRHPGHYAAVNEADEIQSIRHLDESALRGVSKRYYWADLESSKDAYNLDAIKRDLGFLKANNKQLVVFITDRRFAPARILCLRIWSPTRCGMRGASRRCDGIRWWSGGLSR